MSSNASIRSGELREPPTSARGKTRLAVVALVVLFSSLVSCAPPGAGSAATGPTSAGARDVLLPTSPIAFDERSFELEPGTLERDSETDTIWMGVADVSGTSSPELIVCAGKCVVFRVRDGRRRTLSVPTGFRPALVSDVDRDGREDIIGTVGTESGDAIVAINGFGNVVLRLPVDLSGMPSMASHLATAVAGGTSTPVALLGDTVILVVGSASRVSKRGVCAMDLRDGSMLWEFGFPWTPHSVEPYRTEGGTVLLPSYVTDAESLYLYLGDDFVGTKISGEIHLVVIRGDESLQELVAIDEAGLPLQGSARFYWLARDRRSLEPTRTERVVLEQRTSDETRFLSVSATDGSATEFASFGPDRVLASMVAGNRIAIALRESDGVRMALYDPDDGLLETRHLPWESVRLLARTVDPSGTITGSILSTGTAIVVLDEDLETHPLVTIRGLDAAAVRVIDDTLYVATLSGSSLRLSLFHDPSSPRVAPDRPGE